MLGVALPQRRSAAGTLNLPADGDLQEALNSARPGDTIYLAAGATYTGNFVLRARGGTAAQPIVIRTAGTDAVAPGTRLSPADAAGLAKLRSPNSSPALATEPLARGWRLELLEFLANRDGAGDIITLGDGSTSQKQASSVPTALTLDRLYIHGDERRGRSARSH